MNTCMQRTISPTGKALATAMVNRGQTSKHWLSVNSLHEQGGRVRGHQSKILNRLTSSVVPAGSMTDSSCSVELLPAASLRIGESTSFDSPLNPSRPPAPLPRYSRSIGGTSSVDSGSHSASVRGGTFQNFNSIISARRASFSSVAVARDDTISISGGGGKPRTKRKSVMRKRNPLIVTAAAAARIEFLISSHNNGGDESAIGIRLGTKKRGCNGLSYTLNYAYGGHLKKHSRDEAVTIDENDMVVYVEPMALMNIIGTTMDFQDDEMASEFTFTNPNSKGECGCGESFNV